MAKYISISEIQSKIKSREDIINYFREQGKNIIFIISFRSLLPKSFVL